MSDAVSQLQAAYERLKLLYQVSNVIHSTLDPQQALQLILQEAGPAHARHQRLGGSD